jgi:hypothetical protein
MCRIAISALLYLLSSAVAVCQTKSGESARSFHLQGYVVDVAYRSIPNAIVALTPVGAEHPLTTTKALGGHFHISGPAGAYILSIQHPLFRTVEQRLDTWTGRSFNVQITMEILPYSGTYPPLGPPNDLSSSTESRAVATEEPTEASVCDIVGKPHEFNSRLVRFRATMSTRMSERRFDLAYADCRLSAYFTRAERPIEKVLTEEFYSSKGRAIEATLTGRISVVPPNNRFDGNIIQISLQSIADVWEGEKFKIIWVTGRLVDRVGKPIAGVEVTLAAPNRGYYFPNSDLGSWTTDFDGRFRLPGIAPATVTLGIGNYGLRKTFRTSQGVNTNLGDIILKTVDVEKQE